MPGEYPFPYPEKEFYELFAENDLYKLHMNFSFLSPAEKRELIKIRPRLCEYKLAYNQYVQTYAASSPRSTTSSGLSPARTTWLRTSSTASATPSSPASWPSSS